MNLEGVKRSVPGKLAAKFGEDKAINWATLIAWNGLLSMFPIMLVVASVLGLVLGIAHYDAGKLNQTISSALPDADLRKQIYAALDGFRRQSGVFAVVGFLGLMFGGSALFGSMEQGFAIIYHTKPRAFVKQKLLAFGMIVVFSVLAGIAVGTSSVLPALTSIPGTPAILRGPMAVVLQFVVGVFTGFLLFAATYFVVPNRKQAWNKVWPGALLAGVLFEALVLVFPLYLQVNKGISNYGKTFALFLTLMAFFYFLGIVMMVGVEFNSVLYPLPVEQPGNAEALAPAQSGPEGEPQVVGSAESDHPWRVGAGGSGSAVDGGKPAAKDLGASTGSDGVAVVTPEMAEEANAGIAGLAAARERVGRARTLVGVGAIAWALGMVIGRRGGKGKGLASRL